MRSRLAWVLASLVSLAYAATPAGQIDGVSVDEIWRAASFIDTAYLQGPPTLARAGHDFVGSTRLNAPDKGAAIPLTMKWTVSKLDDEASSLAEHVPLSGSAQFIVTGRFFYEPTRVSVTTYCAVGDIGKALGQQQLGLVVDGRFVPVSHDLAQKLFETLGYDGPFVSRAIVKP